MQLDRFTEKAQEAIVRAQELAQGLHSPVLDAEHILSALIEPEDGVPAETLRRLGVDLPEEKHNVRVIEVSPVVDPSSATIEVLAELTGNHGQLRPGMSTNILVPNPQ